MQLGQNRMHIIRESSPLSPSWLIYNSRVWVWSKEVYAFMCVLIYIKYTVYVSMKSPLFEFFPHGSTWGGTRSPEVNLHLDNWECTRGTSHELYGFLSISLPKNNHECQWHWGEQFSWLIFVSGRFSLRISFSIKRIHWDVSLFGHFDDNGNFLPIHGAGDSNSQVGHVLAAVLLPFNISK